MVLSLGKYTVVRQIRSTIDEPTFLGQKQVIGAIRQRKVVTRWRTHYCCLEVPLASRLCETGASVNQDDANAEAALIKVDRFRDGTSARTY